jgi:antitoxin component HigA of HigAB toxin-antitoxin module
VKEIPLTEREQKVYEQLKKMNETPEGVKTLRALQRHYGITRPSLLQRILEWLLG